jgi:hypothetical protein
VRLQRRWPEHLRGKDKARRRKKLRTEGNGLRGLYGVPVFLCGSALLDANAEPRDWDIRITLPDAAFARRYGPVEQWEAEGLTGQYTKIRWRWSDDCVKQSKHAASLTGLNVDVQVYPASYAAHFKHRPRFRLDTRPA